MSHTNEEQVQDWSKSEEQFDYEDLDNFIKGLGPMPERLRLNPPPLKPYWYRWTQAFIEGAKAGKIVILPTHPLDRDKR